MGYGALWADYDNDGFEDLLVIYDSVNAHNALYHNNRDGTFTQITTNVVTTDSWSGGAVGGAWGDYDNDGLPDLFVTDQQGVRNRLYHNNGNGHFTNVTSGPMLKPASSGGAFGCSWGDYDNDGYLDLITTGFNGTNGLYHNNGDGTFTQILSEPPVLNYTPDAATVGVAWVDYDNDGFLDLFITGYDDNTYNLLYHNNGNNNAWLEVKLVGTASNRSAIGAKVRVHATINGKTFLATPRNHRWWWMESSTAGCPLRLGRRHQRGHRAHRMALWNRAAVTKYRCEANPDLHGATTFTGDYDGRRPAVFPKRRTRVSIRN